MDNVKKFIEQLKTDAELQKKVKAAQDKLYPIKWTRTKKGLCQITEKTREEERINGHMARSLSADTLRKGLILHNAQEEARIESIPWSH